MSGRRFAVPHSQHVGQDGGGFGGGDVGGGDVGGGDVGGQGRRRCVGPVILAERFAGQQFGDDSMSRASHQSMLCFF